MLAPHRDEIQLSTKFGYVLDSGASSTPRASVPSAGTAPSSARRSRRACAACGTDRVDLYQLHNPRMDAIDADDCFATLEELRSEGKIRHYGVALGPAIGWRDEGLRRDRQRATSPRSRPSTTCSSRIPAET